MKVCIIRDGLSRRASDADSLGRITRIANCEFPGVDLDDIEIRPVFTSDPDDPPRSHECELGISLRQK